MVGLLLLINCLIRGGTSLSPSNVTDNCLVTFDTINTTFDICGARIESTGGWGLKYYLTTDSRNINYEDNSDGDLYRYYFNIGGPLSLIHPTCVEMNFSTNPDIYGYCEDEDNCDSLTPISDPAWVYQVWFKNSSDPLGFKCYRLSNEFGGPPEWSLYHNGDPSLGIQVTYLNGDHDGCITGNRKFNIRFLCADEILFLPDEYPLYEYTDCEYTIELPSVYGCPVSCPEYDNQLCGGNGKCAFDWTLNRPRCFCYHKWKGEDCSESNAGDSIPSDAVKISPTPNSPFVKEFEGVEVDGSLINVTYDLNEFAANPIVYVVTDLDFRHNHTYYVGIPDVIIPGQTQEWNSISAQCSNIIQPCDNIVNGQCDSIVFGTGYAFIFQINDDTQECLNLGTNVRWELYDEDNPARGVTGVYYDGSWCPQGGRNMELRIHLVCPSDQDAVFHPRNETKIDLFGYVEEDDDTECSYSFTHYSAIACPYQCIGEEIYDSVPTFTVCNQKGICAADPNAGFVRCLCDTGYTGIDCTELATDDPTTDPSKTPSGAPTTAEPSTDPTSTPSNAPTTTPTTAEPTSNPTLGPTKTVAAEEESDDEDEGFKILWIVLIVLCVLLVVAISYVIFKNRKQKAQLQRIDSVDINRDITSGDSTEMETNDGQTDTVEIDGDDNEQTTLR